MTNNSTALLEFPDISKEDYCCFGLATCFVRQSGETEQLKIVEPIPSAAVEAISKGIPTSYEFLCGLTLADFLVEQDLQIPEQHFPEAQFCDRFIERAVAAIRTYRARPQAQELIPLNTKNDHINYSTKRKRILNASSVVRAEDNVKQHQYTHQVL